MLKKKMKLTNIKSKYVSLNKIIMKRKLKEKKKKRHKNRTEPVKLNYLQYKENKNKVRDTGHTVI